MDYEFGKSDPRASLEPTPGRTPSLNLQLKYDLPSPGTLTQDIPLSDVSPSAWAAVLSQQLRRTQLLIQWTSRRIVAERSVRPRELQTSHLARALLHLARASALFARFPSSVEDSGLVAAVKGMRTTLRNEWRRMGVGETASRRLEPRLLAYADRETADVRQQAAQQAADREDEQQILFVLDAAGAKLKQIDVIGFLAGVLAADEGLRNDREIRYTRGTLGEALLLVSEATTASAPSGLPLFVGGDQESSSVEAAPTQTGEHGVGESPEGGALADPITGDGDAMESEASELRPSVLDGEVGSSRDFVLSDVLVSDHDPWMGWVDQTSPTGTGSR